MSYIIGLYKGVGTCASCKENLDGREVFLTLQKGKIENQIHSCCLTILLEEDFRTRESEKSLSPRLKNVDLQTVETGALSSESSSYKGMPIEEIVAMLFASALYAYSG